MFTQMPVLGKYFAIINTLIHESGHSVAALLTGGEVERISLFPNTEGTALTGHGSWWSQVITSLSGYVFASFFSFFFFYLIARERYKAIIYVLLVFLCINLVFWVRNVYGLFWIITFGAGFIWFLRNNHQSIIRYVLLFLTCLVFVESVTSAFEIMWISFISPFRAGDAAHLSGAIPFTPAPLWGIFFFVQALFFAYLALRQLFLNR
jgi:hypothetical protein